MPKALFVVSIFNYHREVRPVVAAFRREGWQVIAAIGWLGQTADDAALDYAAMGCRVFRLPDDMSYRGDASNNDRAATTQPSGGAPPATKPALLRRLVSAVLMPLRLLKLRRRIAGFMDDFIPDVVFQGPFHSCARFDNGFAREARRRGILHCCYPVSAYHGRKPAVLARFNNLAVGMLPPFLRSDFDPLNRFLAWAFPDWTQTRDGMTIFMWEPVSMLASRITGLMENDVWQKPSPDFDSVFVFNSFSKRLLEINGFPMHKVVVAGIPLLDAAVARAADSAARRALLADLGLKEDGGFLLFNVEPSAEHHYCDWDRHWANFRAMMKVATLQRLPVVLSLHPLCRLEDYLFAEAEFGVRISQSWKIHDLYPLCSLAVSFPCSTNLIAAMFDKPLAIYDFFGIASETSPRAEEFRLPGALIGHSINEVTENVLRLVASLPPIEANGRFGAVPPAPTFELATSVMLRHVSDLLKSRPARGLA